MKSKKILNFLAAVITLACGAFFAPQASEAKAEEADKTKYAFHYEESGKQIYDLIGLYNITRVESSGDVLISKDGINYSAPTYPTIGRFIKGTSSCKIFAENLAAAKFKSISCDASCWEDHEPERICDSVEKNNYMGTVATSFTLDIELDDFYSLNGLRWYCYQGSYPIGSISYSKNGTSYSKWCDFSFNKDYLINDPYVKDKSLLFTKYSDTGLVAKFIKVSVTGAGKESVATREFTLYGSKFVPEEVDPQEIRILNKDTDGFINTLSTAYYPGERFSLTAEFLNDESLCVVKWISLDEYMVRVDDYGNCEIIRGGNSDYYRVKAYTNFRDKIYEDVVKIYVKKIINLASISTLTWSGSSFFYGAPAEAFDGIKGVFGNWVQPVDGIETFIINCDLKQQILLRNLTIYIGVNEPESIKVYGFNSNYDKILIKNYGGIISNETLTLDYVGSYYGLSFEITNKSFPSTIAEIEFFNDESFDIGTLIVEDPSDEGRGPGSGKYPIPTNDPSGNDGSLYDSIFNKEISGRIFNYSFSCPIFYIISAPFLVAALTLGIIMIVKLKRGKKDEK